MTDTLQIHWSTQVEQAEVIQQQLSDQVIRGNGVGFPVLTLYEQAIDYVLRCTTRFRLPETTRWAHEPAPD